MHFSFYTRFFTNFLALIYLSESLTAEPQRGGSGLRVSYGGSRNGSLLSGSGRSGGGIQIGTMRNSSSASIGSKLGHDYGRGSGSGVSESPGSVGQLKTTSQPETILVAGGPSSIREDEKENLTVGLILPHSMFYQRDYVRAVTSAISFFRNKAKYKFLERYKLEVQMVMITVSPSPKGPKLLFRTPLPPHTTYNTTNSPIMKYARTNQGRESRK
ncbi:unnamed protein product [Allacma fusca]|uniref:Uncharacterized protein n=1 Tax=Allacma fusca TaxID=39272 RepID=A0A8J2JJW6_9HEXA|nr:unnamed protein product [Allacma fusca]